MKVGPVRRALAAGRALVALIASVALLAGTPLLMWRLVGWPLPHHLPTSDELGDALGGPLSQELVVGVLGCLFWYAWLVLAISYTTELAARLTGRLTGRPRPHLATFGPGQALAAALITTIAAGFLTATLRAPRPAGMLDAQLAAYQPAPAATAPAFPGTEATTNPGPGPVDRLDASPLPVSGQPTANAAKASATPTPTCVVGRYDTLWGLAERHLGDGLRWHQIYTDNQGIPQPDGGQLDDPDLIRPGWILRLPADATNLPTSPDTAGGGTAGPVPDPGQAPPPQTPDTSTPPPAPGGQATPAPTSPGTPTPTDAPNPTGTDPATPRTPSPTPPTPRAPAPWTPTIPAPTPTDTRPAIPAPRPPATGQPAPTTTPADQPRSTPGEHGHGLVHLPSGAALPVSTLAAIAAAVTLARLLRTRRWRFPTPPDQPPPPEPPLPLVIREILRTHRPPTDPPSQHGGGAGNSGAPTPADLAEDEEPTSDEAPNNPNSDPSGPASWPPRPAVPAEPAGSRLAPRDPRHPRGDATPKGAARPATAVLPDAPSPSLAHEPPTHQPPTPAPLARQPDRERNEAATTRSEPMPELLARTGILALDGPGAPATARAIIIAVLVDHHSHHQHIPRPWPARLLLSAVTASRLELPADLLAVLPQVTVTTDDASILDFLETEALHRRRALVEHGVTDLTALRATVPDDAFPTVLAVAEQPTDPAATVRVAGLIRDAGRLGLHVLTLGPTDAIVIGPDGLQTSPPDQANSPWPRLTPPQAIDLLHLTAGAHDIHPPTASFPATATAPAAPDAEGPDRGEGTRAARAAGDAAALSTSAAQPSAGFPPAPESAVSQAGLRVRFTVFGRPALAIDNRAHSGGLSARSLEIAAYLALHTGGVTGDQLAGDLLPDRDPTRARNVLYQDIAKLRSTIRHTTGEPGTLYLAGDKKTGYRLNPTHVAVDLWDFDHALTAAGRARTDPDRIATLTTAATLITGRPFGDAAYEWSAAPAADLEHRALAALVDLADLYANDNPDQALTILDQAITLAPHVEDLYAHAMRIHATRNRPDAVRRTYQRLLDALDHLGLDVDPTPETQNLLARLLRRPAPPR